MTFEELLTENGTKPQLVDYFYKHEGQSKYWNECVQFFNSNHQKKIKDMSPKQALWAGQISEDILEKYLEDK